QVLNDDFRAHQIVLLGEAPHGVPANTFLQAELFIYLNKHLGTKILLIEFGSSDAYLLNKYLKTGESKYFEKSYYGYKKFSEAKNAMIKLFNYNKSLSKDGKLKIVGLDFEREPSLTATVYYFLEGFQDLPEIEDLKQKVKIRYDTIKTDNPKPFLKFLRKEIPKYEHLLNQSPDWSQIKELIYFKSSYEDFWSRDKFMIQRFLKLPMEEKYLGSFGTMHTRLNERKVFAGLLQKNKNYKDKILV
ncbi:MAG: hypothetical protein IH947_11210, partial [Bacteroidetes bacterium]|nr:hypothetical protein [Bacteroidota bacterium]